MDWVETARITYKAHCQHLVRERGGRDINPWLLTEVVGSDEGPNAAEMEHKDETRRSRVLARSFGVAVQSGLV
jgi:hypothetical protein